MGTIRNGANGRFSGKAGSGWGKLLEQCISGVVLRADVMLLKIMRIEQGNNSTLSEIYLQQTALMAAVGTVVSYSTSSCLGEVE